jgi:hypothetical protein
MSRQVRIHVYGKQRQDIDPVLLAQVVILFGRHLHQRNQQHNHQAAIDATASQEGDPSARHHNPPEVTRPEPSPEDTPLPPRNNDGEPS